MEEYRASTIPLPPRCRPAVAALPRRGEKSSFSPFCRQRRSRRIQSRRRVLSPSVSSRSVQAAPSSSLQWSIAVFLVVSLPRYDSVFAQRRISFVKWSKCWHEVDDVCPYNRRVTLDVSTPVSMQASSLRRFVSKSTLIRNNRQKSIHLHPRFTLTRGTIVITLPTFFQPRVRQDGRRVAL